MKEFVDGHGVVSEWGKRLGEGQKMKGIAGLRASRVPGRSCHGCNFRPLGFWQSFRQCGNNFRPSEGVESKTSMVSMCFCIRLGNHFVQSLYRTPIIICHDAAVNDETSTGFRNVPGSRRIARGLAVGRAKYGTGTPFPYVSTYTW